MKKLKIFFGLILCIFMVMTVLTACKGDKEVTSVTIAGDEDVELAFGESITFEATADPTDAADTTITWSVTDTNLGNEYTLEGSTFTAKNLAGYAVLQASSANGKTDKVTIVVNPTFENSETSKVKVTFYAVDGATVIDVRYADADGKVTAPDYAVSNSEISWVDANGAEVDFASLVLTADASFTAKAQTVAAYYAISYWYYGENGTPIQQGETYNIAVGSGDSVPAADVEGIEQAIEDATGKTVINWNAVISDDGLTINWYAELV